MTTDVTLRWRGAAHFQLSWDGLQAVTDPLFSRLPGERPRLEARRDELQDLDLLLLTHGHLDHSADVPSLLGRLRPQTYAPQEVLDALRKHGIDADWSRCHALEQVKGKAVEIAGAEITAAQIATEAIDFWFIRAMFARPWLHGRPQAIPFGIRWLLHHLRCNCFAFHLRFPGGATMLFFGNLTPGVDELAAVQRVDVLAIPYCPANARWQQESVQLIRRFEPRVTLVHHFDNFMHPYTHSRHMNLGRYQELIQRQCPGARLFFAKFDQPVTLDEILNG